jgi:hypothetical protein
LRRAATLFRSEPVTRNGLSFAQNDRRLHSFRPGVNSPGLPLRSHASHFRRPFGLKLHRRFRLAPVPAASPFQTRCAFHDWRGQRCAFASTPLWDSYIPPDQSVGRMPRQPARLPVRPIPDCSPLPSISSIGGGSSFPVRYARPSALADHRVHYDGLCLPAGSAFRVWLPS